MNKQIKFLNTVLIIIIFIPFITQTSNAEGNHTWAKSEAWTWMGHLNVVNTQEQWTLGRDGFGFIHYYTRNETGLGRMNFKSSAVTKTKEGKGLSYDKRTIYPEANTKSFQLHVAENQLAIEFFAPGQQDSIKEVTLTQNDLSLLYQKILPLYSGLKIASGWSIQKYHFKAQLGYHHKVNLNLYAIWPDISPPEQKMDFFGIQNSYTYSSPMLVAFGDWSENQEPAKKVLGLCFLDRQWSKDYFGKEVFKNPTDFLKRNHALSWAHNWSAFHAHAPESNDWYFVHLWQQFKRDDTRTDKRANYTGIQWSKNGNQQTPITSSEFSWTPNKYILNSSKVLINFASGRDSFFPFKYHFSNPKNNSYFEFEASPKLQSLDQPIYLFEGYARGHGTWDHQEVHLQGRIESSQILFRDSDYEDMLRKIERSDKEQELIAETLEDKLAESRTCRNPSEDISRQQQFLFNNMKQKLQIFSAQFDKKPVRKSKDTMVYY